MKEPTLFDDAYTGPRFTYGLNNRPVGTAQIPDGWIIWSDRDDPRFRHGTVQYPRQLSDREVAAFELTPVQE